MATYVMTSPPYYYSYLPFDQWAKLQRWGFLLVATRALLAGI